MLRFLLCLVVTCAYAQNNGDLESVIKEIFGDPNSSTQSNPPTPQPSTSAPVTQINIQNNNIQGGGTSSETSCTTEDGEVGECVQYYLCNSNNSVITDGVGIIDIRVREGPCPSYFEICCLLADRRPPDQPITPPPTVTPTPEPGQPDKPAERTGCGWRNPEGVGFRIKGDADNEAKFGEFPWMVAILKIEPVNANDPEGQKLNVYVGGGSLIHPRVVLTAAHYVANASSLRVRAGEWDTQTKNEIYPFQDRDVVEIKVHRDYNAGTLYYDIALLFLASPMELAPNVGIVCLPPRNDKPAANTHCFASGWGKDQYGKEGRYQVILKKVEVPVVDRNTCQDRLRRTRLGRFFELHSSFMCAGGEAGKDTCKGDGGSPLVCPIPVLTSEEYDIDPRENNENELTYEPDRYHQNGIVAWGIGCGEDGTPGVYVDVAKMRDWIDDALAGKGYSITDYNP